MMMSGTCVRLAIVAAVFLIAAIFLVPQLPNVGYNVPTSLGHHTPTADGKDAPTGTSIPNDPLRKPAGAADATTSLAVPSAPHSSTEVKGSAPKPSSDSVPEVKPDTKTVSKLEPGQTLSPFRLTSPNGRYKLHLLDSGSLSLLDTNTNAELFTSDTEYHWPVTWQVELTQEGVLMLSWANETAAPYGATPWVSNLLPDCGSINAGDEKPVLELLDSGRLHIRAGSKTTCLLHRAADDMGRLAIVYTGFLRTYLKTCKEQNNKLVKTWTGSGGVDVHVFTYLEDVNHDSNDPVDKESITKHLKSCFGESLKTVEIRKLGEVKESVLKPPAVLVKECGEDKLNHQLSQWKALYLASQQVQSYMMKEGISYDYIYKGRLDLLYWGDSPALSSLKVPENGILAPRVTLDWTWYAMLHDGELRAGVTDITAFGRPNAMFTYLALYREFIYVRTLEKETAKWKGFNTKTREKKPEGQEGCTPEGILAYWLRINGIAVKTDWRFKMGLLRGDGKIIFTCPEGRGWLCPGFIPQVHDDGTLS
ncbi:hypothetical protein CTA2_7357 [Colletotrichum tanaceti]|uniref:Uncharacterized protein n=1 Tax=Colletotrichum tanaceti TaxID=1306861 RepID=A0A4U6XND3_9PEZI|nr:hypothetical protein CTA2_7357 [Colletotrichum tanaceti]TKW57255.1 hypothetical protein CTA1_2163 [Colletotrichum tanaceti]